MLRREELRQLVALRKTHDDDDSSAVSADVWLTGEMWGDMAVIVGRDCVLSVHGECYWKGSLQ